MHNELTRKENKTKEEPKDKVRKLWNKSNEPSNRYRRFPLYNTRPGREDIGAAKDLHDGPGDKQNNGVAKIGRRTKRRSKNIKNKARKRNIVYFVANDRNICKIIMFITAILFTNMLGSLLINQVKHDAIKVARLIPLVHSTLLRMNGYFTAEGISRKSGWIPSDPNKGNTSRMDNNDSPSPTNPASETRPTATAATPRAANLTRGRHRRENDHRKTGVRPTSPGRPTTTTTKRSTAWTTGKARRTNLAHAQLLRAD